MTAPSITRDLSRCRSCGATIVWARTTNHTSIPLDADQHRDLVIVADSPLEILQDVPLVVRTLRGRRVKGPRSHYATCPQAASWRKKNR